MKILLTIDDITIVGGAERVVVNLANALSGIGYDVEILSFFMANDKPLYEINDNVKLSFWYRIAESKHKERFLKSRILSIYYKNLHKAILSFKMQMKYHFVNAIIASCSIYRPFLKSVNTICVKIMHLNFISFHKRNARFDSIILLSSRELSTYQRYHKNLTIIPNFLPSIPTQSSILDSRIVLSVGRMDNGDQKGFLRLIDIWKLVMQDVSLKDWKLHIVGDGVLKQEIQSKIQAFNLQDSIILKPFTQDIEQEYLQASIYAMSSHFEGFGMVLVESASYGLPAIAFDVNTGPSDIIEQNKSGFLREDNNLQDFALKLQNLMKDKDLRITLGSNAKQRVKQKFSKAAIMPLWEKVLNKT